MRAPANAPVAGDALGARRHENGVGAGFDGSARQQRELAVVADQHRELAERGVEHAQRRAGRHAPAVLERRHDQLVLHADGASRRDELRRVDEAPVRRLRRARADENVHAMLCRELRMERDALLGDVRNALERRREVVVDFRAEAGGLLDRRVFRKNEQLRAGRRACGHPRRDLVFPLRERARLADRILGRRDLEDLRRGHQSAFIQNCIVCVVSSAWSTSFQSYVAVQSRHGRIAALGPEAVERNVVGGLQRVVVGAHDAAEGRMREPAERTPACPSRRSKNLWPSPCPRWLLSSTLSPQ